MRLYNRKKLPTKMSSRHSKSPLRKAFRRLFVLTHFTHKTTNLPNYIISHIPLFVKLILCKQFLSNLSKNLHKTFSFTAIRKIFYVDSSAQTSSAAPSLSVCLFTRRLPTIHPHVAFCCVHFVLLCISHMIFYDLGEDVAEVYVC